MSSPIFLLRIEQKFFGSSKNFFADTILSRNLRRPTAFGAKAWTVEARP